MPQAADGCYTQARNDRVEGGRVQTLTNPFTWDYLSRVPKGLEAYGPLALAYLVVFVLGLAACVLANRLLGRRFRDHALHLRLTRRATQVATWIFGIGLTFFAFRALELPLLGMRLWLYLSVLALIVAAGLGLWYRLARYPAALARYQQEQARQQYLRPSQPAKVRRSSAGRRRR
jgi:hypothetical protein